MARVVRLENRFVGMLDWTTIHEERQTGTLAEAATTAATPAIVPREYYTTPFPDPRRPCQSPFPPTRRIRSERIPSRFHIRSPLLVIHEHPTGTPLTRSPPHFSSSPPLANGRPYYVP